MPPIYRDAFVWMKQYPRTHWILELRIDLRDDLSHRLQFRKHVFLSTSTQHGAHLWYEQIRCHVQLLWLLCVLSSIFPCGMRRKVVQQYWWEAGTHLLYHRTKSSTQLTQFPKRFLQYRWERKETKGVTGRSGIKDDTREFHGFDVPVKRYRIL